jgi:hypothetical protein
VDGAWVPPVDLLDRRCDPPAWLRLCGLTWDPRLGKEGYRLQVMPPGEVPGAPLVQIEAATTLGLWHGRRTLAQLIRSAPVALPGLVIEDWPAFPVRGVMLDVSRDRVPTLASLLEAAELLASWKVNHLQLYTEHTFAYEGHEAVWEGWSPVTPGEVELLDRRCGELGIELTPNQNCFGHLTRWLVHEPYTALAETLGPWDFFGHHREEPFSLCPVDPRSRALVQDLLGQLLPCFTSSRVNIGCDETADVGQGRSREAVAARGHAAVYLEFLAAVGAIARQHGRQPLFWADMVMRDPDGAAAIPDGMVPLLWGYEPDAPFAAWAGQLQEAGVEYWVCPGTSSWRSITGRTAERRGNLAAAARATGAEGFLVTDWGDLGHRQQWPIGWHGLAAGADAAWHAGVAGDLDPRAAGVHALGDPTGAAGIWLDRLGDADRELRQATGLRNATTLFVDLDTPFAAPSRPGSLAQWEEVNERLAELAASVPAGLEDPRVQEELRHSVTEAQLAATRACWRRRSNPPSPNELQDLRDRLRRLTREHRRLWMARCRPGGLEDSLEYYRAMDLE